MSRTTVKQCDVCRKPTEQIVGKLLFVPLGISRFSHSNYTNHCDVGVCCKDKLFKAFDFQDRTTAAQYQERRRAGVG